MTSWLPLPIPSSPGSQVLTRLTGAHPQEMRCSMWPTRCGWCSVHFSGTLVIIGACGSSQILFTKDEKLVWSAPLSGDTSRHVVIFWFRSSDPVHLQSQSLLERMFIWPLDILITLELRWDWVGHLILPYLCPTWLLSLFPSANQNGGRSKNMDYIIQAIFVEC